MGIEPTVQIQSVFELPIGNTGFFLIKDKFEDQNRTFSFFYEKSIISEDGQLIEHIEE